MAQKPKAPTVLLIITGSIAAYKSLELVRRLREREVAVRCIVTKGAEQFVTALSFASLSGSPAYTDLFSLKDEAEMGHIRLSREADLVVVAPATADIIAKLVHGQADDLATATLLASNKKLLVAPAMNTQMWNHKATTRNIKQLQEDGAVLIAPGSGDLACGETGQGRMAEVDVIVDAILAHLPTQTVASPARFTALVTSGPTHEAIDPVRYIANHSSGKQGHAIAAALVAAGAHVTLVTGPTNLPAPAGVKLIGVTTAQEMLAACQKALPVDVAVCAAAVADWRLEAPAKQKLKKGKAVPSLSFIENPDILKTLSAAGKKRPKLVVGFAAETTELLKHASSKLAAKGCDWMLANDVSAGQVFGEDDNQVTFLTAKKHETWKRMSKNAVAAELAARIATFIKG